MDYDLHLWARGLAGYRVSSCTAPENLEHLLWSCPHSCTFWQDLSAFISQHILSDFSFSSLSLKDVLFGFSSYPTSKSNQFYIINLLLILAKAHIHKMKFSSSKPSLHLNENPGNTSRPSYSLKTAKPSKPSIYVYYLTYFFPNYMIYKYCLLYAVPPGNVCNICLCSCIVTLLYTFN
ncbi:hypothetical protein AALO_G00142290 [Alosa alosa]|uniref:Reverse transcriptase zinc-binding domain-containing protein n=1 Tax=Alosa alosa TaxID=278164 RepID=A0AAV6GIB8_9TELE|nr:hypothetical protein AALO_G00142290 [Alosa alosa]